MNDTASSAGARTYIRCGDCRRRLCRHVHAVPAAQSRLLGARLRSRKRRGRHLVLEPLSRRALRRRERAVLVSVLGRSAAGMGMERALCDAARDPALCQSRRRSLRSAQGHPARYARERCDFRRGAPPLDDRARGRHRGVGTLLHHGDGLPVVDQYAEVPGSRLVSRRGLSHRPVAARGGRLHRPARRRDRHRLFRDPIDPAHRRAGAAPVRLPAHAALHRAGPQYAPGSRVQAPGQGRVPGHAQPREADVRGHRPAPQRSLCGAGERARSGSANTKRAGRTAG